MAEAIVSRPCCLPPAGGADFCRQPLLFFLSLLLVGAAAAACAQPEATATVPAKVVTAVSTDSPVDDATAISSRTPAPVPTTTATSLPSSTATPLPTVTPTASPTPLPTATATPSPTPFPTLRPDLVGSVPIPTPVSVLQKPATVTNLLILGNDVPGLRGGRTDSLLLISVNRETATASLLSLPRDLYVAVPGWKMARINQALPHGHGSDYLGGGGQLIKDTVLYNLGIPVDYYVRIGFDGFKQLVDLLGGVEIPVTCPVTDWRLLEPDLDPQVEENWEMFRLEPGVYWMNGDLALWYARSRRGSSDFERGRRQQELVQALLARGLRAGLIPRIPDLWSTYRESVETDLTLPALLELARLAPAVAENGVQHLYLAQAVRPWRTPAGAAVQLLRPREAQPVLMQLMQPPLLRRGERTPPLVELRSRDDLRYRLAEANLGTAGFPVIREQAPATTPARNQVVYTGATTKGTSAWLLAWALDITETEIRLQPPGEMALDPYFQVTLGSSYDPCRPQLEAPLATP